MAIGLPHTAFIRLTMILLTLGFWNSHHKVMLDFVKDYFCLHGNVLVLGFIYIHVVLTDCCMLNHTCIPTMEPIYHDYLCSVEFVLLKKTGL